MNKYEVHVHWSQTHATFRAGIERFKETGALPPEGVTLLGRWFGMNGQGFAVVEASDAKASSRMRPSGRNS